MKPGWTEVALGDVCEIVSGATPKTSVAEYWDGDVSWATPKDLSDLGEAKFIGTTERSISEAGLKSCAAQVLPVGSVLLSSRAPIGLVAINKTPMATNQGFKSLIPSKKVDASYLFYWLRGHKKQIQSLGRGATFKEISKAITAEIAVPLPPLEEQRRIAAILDTADELRAKRRAAIAQLDTLPQSIFLDMFGSVAGRGVTLGTILSEASVFTDGDWVESKDQDPSGDVRLIQLADIGVGKFLDKSARFLTSDRATELRCTYLEPGDVLVARMPDPLGRACIFPGVDQPAVTVVDVCIIRPESGALEPVWLAAALNSHSIKSEMLRRATGSTRQRIARSALAGLHIRVPRIDEQREFRMRVAGAAALSAHQDRQLADADVLFASLQSRAFAGEL